MMVFMRFFGESVESVGEMKRYREGISAVLARGLVPGHQARHVRAHSTDIRACTIFLLLYQECALCNAGKTSAGGKERPRRMWDRSKMLREEEGTEVCNIQ